MQPRLHLRYMAINGSSWPALHLPHSTVRPDPFYSSLLYNTYPSLTHNYISIKDGLCHDHDIPPHPVYPQSHLHADLFALNSPHPNLIHIQTLLPLVLAFMCTLQHLQHLCKHA